MKKLIVIVLVFTFALPLMAQQSKSLFEQLTEKYANKDGFSASQISDDMFDLYLKKKDIEKDSPLFDALEDLDNIVVISQSKYGRAAQLVREGYIKAEDAKTEKQEKNDVLHQEILDHYKKQNFTLLKTEKRLGEDVKVYLKKNAGLIESLALITNSSVSTNLVELQGDIDLKTVSELGNALSLRGLENLYKIDSSKSSQGRTYVPGFSAERMEEMIARQREWAEQYELSEEQKAKIEEQAQKMAQKQAELAEKYRQMAETYGRQPIFLGTQGDENTEYYLDGKKVDAEKIKELKKGNITSIEVNKAEKENEITTIRIKTK